MKLRIPEIKVMPSCEGSLIHIVFINGDAKYKCITKERGNAIKRMIDALIEVYHYMDSGDEPIREEVKQALLKVGCTE